MVRFDVFPGLKRKCITFGFFDSDIGKKRLKTLFEKYNVKLYFYKQKETIYGHNSIECEWRQVEELFDSIKNDKYSLLKENTIHIWGNSEDLCSDAEWEELENILIYISCQSNVWIATMEEFKSYLEAQEKLIISEDEEIFLNTSEIDVCIQRFGNESFCIPAGKKIDMRRCK